VLLGRIAQGDRLSMEVLYARHHVRVFRFVLRLIQNEATAEDLVAEAFIEVWRHADWFEGRSAVSSWILGIARFQAFSTLKHRSTDELDERTAESIEDLADNPATVLERKDISTAIRRCVKKLSAQYREIIDLAYYQEKSVEEIAYIVGIPKNTVKTRMHRARMQLAELLKSAGVERD
jgi:RNA polymerase sigma-70 factor (ECF subfamily)